MSVTLKPKGLVNLGNTCYFNSVMQVLLNAPLLGNLLEGRTSSSENKYLLEDPDSNQAIEVSLPECDHAVRALRDLYNSYKSKDNISKPVAPTKLINCIRLKTNRFPRHVQEDSHDLLRVLVDIIRSDEARRHELAIKALDNKKLAQNIKAFTIIDIIFGGYFLSSVKCQKCKFISKHLEPFYDLSLAIADPISDVNEAISNFTSNAILDGNNKFICDRCTKSNGQKTYEAGVKSTKIAVPPNVLTLHLKRFEASSGDRDSKWGGLGGGRRNKKNSGANAKKRGKRVNKNDDSSDEEFVSTRGGISFRKINKHVEFTEFLDLAEFTCDLCYDLTKVNKWPRIRQGESLWYSLFGVVCHSGNLRGGHYTAYVKLTDEDDNEFAQFIQETPYIPELADIDKIEGIIKQHDASRSKTTARFSGEDSDEDGDHNGDGSHQPKSRPGNWYHISDSDVRKSSLSDVLNSQAYILFYKRIVNLRPNSL